MYRNVARQFTVKLPKCALCILLKYQHTVNHWYMYDDCRSMATVPFLRKFALLPFKMVGK